MGLVAPQRLVVLHEGLTPTLSYFYPAIAAQFPGVPAVRFDISGPPEAHMLQPNDYVVVLRYLTRPWQRAIARSLPQLSGLAYFMDDDLLDPKAWGSLPLAYKRRLKDKAGRFQRWWLAHCTAYWVSTPALAQKYAALMPRLVAAQPSPEVVWNTPPPNGHALTIAYHGTMSHWDEMRWLLPVMQQVLRLEPQVGFQVFGPDVVRKLYSGLPRTTVVHPMSWPDYLHFTRANRAHIALAPLLPGAFNAGRGAVKFYDYTRMGAAGVYANCPPYSDFIRHETDGLLLSNNTDAWVDGILALVSNAPLRLQLANAAQARAQAIVASGVDNTTAK